MCVTISHRYPKGKNLSVSPETQSEQAVPFLWLERESDSYLSHSFLAFEAKNLLTMQASNKLRRFLLSSKSLDDTNQCPTTTPRKP